MKTIKKVLYPYVIFIRPFQPLEKQDGTVFVDGYYKAYQELFAEMQQYLKELADKGVKTAKHNGSYKRLLCELGLASFMKSQLTYIESFGTSYVVEVVVVKDSERDFYELSGQVSDGEASAISKASGQEKACIDCNDCVKACPTGALSEASALCKEKCIRQMQLAVLTEDNPYKDKIQNMVLGCDICQRVCPKNSHIALRKMTEEECEYFNTSYFLEQFDNPKGEAWEFYENYMGVNYLKGQKLEGLKSWVKRVHTMS